MYTAYSEMPDMEEELHLARVHLGVAKGHQFMETISSCVSTEHMHKLLPWKHVRQLSDSEEEEEEEGEVEEEGEEEDGEGEGASEGEQGDLASGATEQDSNKPSDLPQDDDKET